MFPPLTDNPVTEIDSDAFGFRPYIEELHDVVAAATSLPMTVGVFGTWGSGKSSFLRMWENLLTSSPTTRTLWFNPWKYDQKIEVWAALIQSLLAEIQNSPDRRLREKAGRLARTVAWLALRGTLGVSGALVSGLTGGLVGESTVNEVLSTTTRDESDRYQDVNRFESDFADAVRGFVGKQGRLVVFIDDLDRCTPVAALNVLEALKLFLGDARCVFVLAMDFDLLATVAGQKFGDGAPITGAEYLEKIVQLPFFLPGVSFDALRAALAPSAGALADNDAFWELVRIGLGANPRRIKRYLNTLNLAVAIAVREGWNGTSPLPITRQLQLAELLILRGEHRAFFRHLRVDPGAWQRLEGSPALPEPGGTAPVKAEREPDPALARFLEDRALTALLQTRPGSYHDHPPAPGPTDVERMLHTIWLTTGTPDRDTPGDEGR